MIPTGVIRAREGLAQARTSFPDRASRTTYEEQFAY